MHSKGRFDEIFSGSSRGDLEARLRDYVVPRRWFRSKTRAVVRATLEHVVSLRSRGKELAITVVRVGYADGPDEQYIVPLTWVHGDSGDHHVRARPETVIGSVAVEGESEPRWIVDALTERRALEAFFEIAADAAANGATIAGENCVLAFRAIGEGLPRDGSPEARPIQAEQSNTSVVFGDACVLKIVRKLEEGTAPDLEMSEFLTTVGYVHTPQLLGAIELRRNGREAATVGAVHSFVPNEGDAWAYAVAAIRSSWTVGRDGPDVASAPIDRPSAFVGPLAVRVAELHSVLCSPSSDPRFAPEAIERPEREALGRDVAASVAEAWKHIDEHAESLPRDAMVLLRRLRGRGAAVDECIARFVGATEPCVKTRVHGDLHLGQVLVSAGDFILIDFEGEPARPLPARKAKRSPLVDVAGMLRSLHYASVAAWRGGADGDGTLTPSEARARATAEAWHSAARREFLQAYFDAAGARSVLPVDADARDDFLRFYLLEKCVYELHYELNNRPDWVAIPVLGLEDIFNR